MLQKVVASVLRVGLRRALGQAFRSDLPVVKQRRRLELIAKCARRVHGVECTETDCGGVPCALVRAQRAQSSANAVLYLHGGGYCVGSHATHTSLGSHIAHRTGASVFVLNYRLAPEHPCPAATDDAVRAYHGLRELGWPPERIALIGDSAGGGLALAVLQRLRDLGEALPAAVVLFSPWIDLGLRGLGSPPSGVDIISAPWLHRCASNYLGGRDVDDPLGSPIHGEMHGLPPTLIQVGGDELLLSDAHRLHSALLSANVTVQLQEFARRWHVFQANAGLLADADRALADAADFLGAHWPKVQPRSSSGTNHPIAGSAD